MKTKWICSGFERNAKAQVLIFWECEECEFEMPGNGLNPPDCECPECYSKGVRGNEN